jgi:putative membrane protein
MIAHGMWSGPGWWILMPLVWLAFWAVVVVALVAVIRSGRGGRIHSSSPALRLLEERYARGEISREEFLERRAVLKGGSAAPAPPTAPIASGEHTQEFQP